MCVCVCGCGRAVHREEMKILHDRVSDCVKREEVNHLQRCRPHYMAYWKSLRKYHSEGESLYAFFMHSTYGYVSRRTECFQLEPFSILSGMSIK